MNWNPATSAPIRPVWAFVYFLGLKKLIAVTSGRLFWCCLLFFSWNVPDNRRTLSGLFSPSRGTTKTVKLMKEIITQGPSWLLHQSSKRYPIDWNAGQAYSPTFYFTAVRVLHELKCFEMWRRDSLCSAGSDAKAKASKPSMPKNNTSIFSIS